jgi:capsule polysaccharide export protein KpsE/RkpR
VESLRQNSVIHEIDAAPAVEFPTPAEPEAQERPALADLWLIWENRRLVYRVAIRALIISTIIAFLIPRKYDSNVRLMPPDSQGDTGMMMAALAGRAVGGGSGAGTAAAPAAGLASLAGSMLGMKNSGALFVDLMHSRTVQDHIVDRFNLQSVYWERYKQDAREVLDDRTDVKEDRKSGVITLTVRDRNRQRAHDMAQAYVDELNKLLAQVSTSSARRQRIFIENRLVTVKADLEQAERDFSGYASKNTTLDIKEQAKAMVESAAMLQGQMIAAQSELEGLEQVYTPNNVRVKAARARVGELRNQLQKMTGTDASLEPDAPKSDALYPSIRELPLRGVQWADLYRRTKIQETVFELLTQQYEMARIQEAKEIPTVNVVDPPNFPEKKSFPPIWLVIAGLTTFSVVGTVAWIVGKVRWDSLDPDDPGKRLATSVGRETSRQFRILGNSAFFARVRMWLHRQKEKD